VLILQLIALALLAFSLRVLPTLFSSAPAYPRPWLEVLLTTGVIAAIVFGLGSLAPVLSQGLTILLVLVALAVPGTLVGLRWVTWGEQASARRQVARALHKAMERAHVENLAAFFAQPSGPLRGLATRPEDIDQLARYVASLPAEELERHQVAQHLLLGLELRPTQSQSSQLPDASLEALCRLYVDLERRLGLSPEALSLNLRQRARIASRVAELGLDGWRGEIVAQDHPAFNRLNPFYTLLFEEVFPEPLPPGERVVSFTLGSLPLYLLLQADVLSRPDPGTPPQDDPYGFGRNRLQELREALELMKSRGIDFTEEELRDADLQTFLRNVRALVFTSPLEATPAPE
jgi:hypothetical protein